MVNFRDIKPQNHFRSLALRHSGPENYKPCIITAEGANAQFL